MNRRKLMLLIFSFYYWVCRKPKAVALVQNPICVSPLSHAPLLPRQQRCFRLTRLQYMQTRCSTAPKSLCCLLHNRHSRQSFAYDMTSLCMLQNHATHLLPSPRPSANHVQVLLSVWQGRERTWDERVLLGATLQGHGWPHIAKRSVERFDFHFQRRWPACGQCHYCWPLLDKVTDDGAYHPALVLWSLHSFFFSSSTSPPLGGSRAFLLPPALRRVQITYLWHLRANGRKKKRLGERTAVWLSLPVSFDLTPSPSLTHYRCGLSLSLSLMFSPLLASPLAPDAAQTPACYRDPAEAFRCHRY